jgi:metallo-beta-lactamase superfamily protein
MEENKTKPSIGKRIAGLLVILIILSITVVGILRMTGKELVGFVVFLAVMVGLGALSVRFATVNRAIPVVFAGLIWFFLWIFITLAPISIFLKLSQFILFKRSLRFQVATLLAWGLILFLAVLLIATKRYRTRLFQLLRDVGSLAPVVYSFNVLMIAVNFFAAVTYVLVNNGVIKMSNAAGTAGIYLFPKLLDFYTWHFLDAVPLLKVNQTLRWSEPLTYDSGNVGVILLLFKITVIIPVIAAFTGYWKYEDDRIRLEDHVLAPQKGSGSGLHVTFFGVSTLLFEDGESAFMVDGFFTRPRKLRTLFTKIRPNAKLISQYLERAGIKELEAVIVAHSHYDHALDAPEVAKQTKARLIGSESTARIGRAFNLPPDRIQIISDGETEQLGNFGITFIRSHHSPIRC